MVTLCLTGYKKINKKTFVVVVFAEFFTERVSLEKLELVRVCTT